MLISNQEDSDADPNEPDEFESEVEIVHHAFKPGFDSDSRLDQYFSKLEINNNFDFGASSRMPQSLVDLKEQRKESQGAAKKPAGPSQEQIEHLKRI